MNEDEIMKLVTLLTNDPSDENISKVVDEVQKSVKDIAEAAAIIEIIGMAVEPIHEGITGRLRGK